MTKIKKKKQVMKELDEIMEAHKKKERKAKKKNSERLSEMDSI